MFASQCVNAPNTAIKAPAAINQKNTERQPPINLANIGNAKQIKTMIIRRCMAQCRPASGTLRGSSRWVVRLFDEGIGIPEKIVDIIEVRQFGPIGRLEFFCQEFACGYRSITRRRFPHWRRLQTAGPSQRHAVSCCVFPQFIQLQTVGDSYCRSVKLRDRLRAHCHFSIPKTFG
jgi:hypothetical protein